MNGSMSSRRLGDHIGSLLRLNSISSCVGPWPEQESVQGNVKLWHELNPPFLVDSAHFSRMLFQPTGKLMKV